MFGAAFFGEVPFGGIAQFATIAANPGVLDLSAGSYVPTLNLDAVPYVTAFTVDAGEYQPVLDIDPGEYD